MILDRAVRDSLGSPLGALAVFCRIAAGAFFLADAGIKGLLTYAAYLLASRCLPIQCTEPDDLIDAYINRDLEAAVRELPEALATELTEFILRSQIEEYLEEELAKRVAKGEMIKRTDENGETVYEPASGTA